MTCGKGGLRSAALSCVVALASCGGPLPNADVRSGEPTEAEPSAPDAGVSDVHSMTITACWRDPARCHSSETTVTTDLYRVASGMGAGDLRSREQALTDVYRELRDRTGLGSRLLATPHRIDAQADARAPAAPRAAASSASPGSDPLVSAAKELLFLVDTEGQITLDPTHGRTACKVSVAGPKEDSRRRCLVEGEHTNGYEDPTTPREREKRFGM